MYLIARWAVEVRQIMGSFLGRTSISAVPGTPGIRTGALCVTVLLAAMPAVSEAAWTAVNEGLPTALAAASDGTQYVAVGSAGEIHLTEDGVTWTAATNPDGLGRLLRGVVWSGSQFVAVGSACSDTCSTAALLTSPDGATWTSRNSSTIVDLTAVASSGSVYVAVGAGGRIIRSTDGITWSIQTSATTNSLYGVTYGDGQFVAVGASATVLTSPDGSTWTVESTVPGSSTLFGVTDFDGLYVVVGSGGILTTSDFVTWAQPITTSLSGVSVGDGLAVAVGSTYVYTSTNGSSWTQQTLPAKPAGSAGTLEGVAWGEAGFIAVGDSGTVLTSTDGTTWTNRTADGSRAWQGVAYNGAGYCAVGLHSSVAASTDGTTWTNVTPPVPANWYSITASGATFVAVGATSTVIRSTDCQTWASGTLPAPAGMPVLSINDVSYGDGLYVAVGYSFGSTASSQRPYVATSPDGASWTKVSPGLPEVPGSLYSVAYGAGRFVALGSDGGDPATYYLTTSEDGVTWTAGTAPTGSVYDVVFHDNQFVGVGVSTIWTSPDGLSWTQVASVNHLYGVAYGAGQYVAVGYVGQILSAPDGQTWTAQTTVGTRDLHGVAYNTNDHQFVAVGTSIMAYANEPALSVADASVTEGGTGPVNVDFTVTLSQASDDTVTVDYATSDGTATASSDYTAVSGTLSFAPGITTKTVSVPILDDTIQEANETFTLNLSHAAYADISAGQAFGTIEDDDPPPSVSIADTTVTEGSGGSTNAELTVTLSGPSGLTVSVDYDTADGTATAGSDYSASSGTVTFAPGVTTQTISVPIVTDTLSEPDETFSVSLSNPANVTIPSGEATATGTILDDDGLVSVSVGSVAVPEGSSGSTNAGFIVSLSAASGWTVTVHYATAAGTATAGTDFTAVPDTELTFAPGETSKTVYVAVTPDTLSEPNETFTVSLTSPMNATIAGGPATGTILDDDPLVSVSIGSNVSLTEGDSASTNETFTVSLSAASGWTVTVDYATTGVTATAGSDFTATSGTLTFAPGETSKTFDVPVLGDTLSEPTETFTVGLTNPAHATISGGPATVTIHDDDPLVSVAMGSDVSQTEGDSGSTNAAFDVSLSAASGWTVTVDYATAAGSATAGVDFTPVSGTLTFAPGETSKTIDVPVIGDTSSEPDETFTVTLANPAHATIGDAAATGTILDDDAPPTLSIGNVSQTEGNSGTTDAQFIVSLSAVSGWEVTVHYATAAGTATAGIDFTTVPDSTLTFAVGETSKTIDVPVIGDALSEPDETFTLNLTSPTHATIADGQGVGTILDDDPASLSITDVSVLEGNSGVTNAVFVVTLSPQSAQTVTVGYSTADDTAFAGSDYTSSTGTLTFIPGATTQEIIVPVLGDTLPDGTGRFFVDLSTPVNASLADGQAIGTILDDDSEAVQWTRRVGVTVSGTTLTRPASSGWNAGAVSTKALVSGDGYAEYTTGDANRAMFGLSHGDTDQGYGDIDYAIYAKLGQLLVYENGTYRGSFGEYSPGDVLRVAIEGSEVKYFRDGDLLYSHSVTPTYPLVVDTSLYVTGASIQDARLAGQLVANVTWTDLVGASTSGFSLKRAAGTGFSAGAVSSQVLVSGDGFVEYTVTDDTSRVMFGLSHGNTDQGYADIDYAIYAKLGQLLVYENGTYRGSFGTYAAGDRLRVSVEGGQVKYYQNGTPLATPPPPPPVYPLLLDVSIYTSGAEVQDAVFGGAVAQNVSWVGAVGVTANGSDLTRTSGSGWNAGAVSAQALASGDGYAEMTVTNTTDRMMFGLSHGDTNQSYDDIDFGMYAKQGMLLVFENGTLRWSGGTCVAGDRLRVGVEGGTVTYRQNGTLLYASTVPPKYPLLVDTSLFASGSTVTAPVIFGDLGEYAAWTDRVGVSPSGINLTRAAGTGWNAGAVSSRSLASGDGYAEMTVASLTDRMMFGLSHGDTSQSYQDIDFAIYTYSVSGTLVVFENGSYRGSFGSYAVGDRLRVSVEGGKVVYRRNGAPFYTSSVAPIYPLLVDTSFYAVAGTIPGVMLCGPGWMADSVPAQDVDWVHLMGVTASGSTLTRPTGAGWDAGAVSHQSLAAGDGFAEFSVASMTDKLMFGLSRGDTDQSYQDIDFALYTYAAAGTLVVFENGSYRGSFGSYAVGDRLRVSVEGGKVTYRRNGALLYASTVAPTYPLQVDTSLASTGATIAGAMLGGALP